MVSGRMSHGVQESQSPSQHAAFTHREIQAAGGEGCLRVT